MNKISNKVYYPKFVETDNDKKCFQSLFMEFNQKVLLQTELNEWIETRKSLADKKSLLSKIILYTKDLIKIYATRIEVLSSTCNTVYYKEIEEAFYSVENQKGIAELRIKSENVKFLTEILSFCERILESLNVNNRIVWQRTFTDFAFLISNLKSKGFINLSYKEILEHFLIEGEVKSDKQLTDLISKINAKSALNNPSQDIKNLML